MARKVRGNARNQRTLEGLDWVFWGTLSLFVVTAIAAMALWPTQGQAPVARRMPPPAEESPPTVYTKSYLETGLPDDDEAARQRIATEYFARGGYTVYEKESDVPFMKVMVPDQMFPAATYQHIAMAIQTIGALMGEQDPAFIVLRDWMVKKEDRLIKEIVPLTHQYGIGQGENVFFVDAFWFPDTGLLYLAEWMQQHFMLITSTLYQEALHATQMQGLTAAERLQRLNEFELEAHAQQLEFNRKLLDFIASSEADEARRWRLEVEVINRNLEDSIRRYQANRIEREGIAVPRSK
ncbi:MAG: hypothetical protein KDD69_10870 [Bdellovibrionales bacterium]|nr:hypothetical protein [Bdellovibrionales bacterium]